MDLKPFVITGVLVILLVGSLAKATKFDDKAYLVTLHYDAGQVSAQNVTTVNRPSGFNPDHNDGPYALHLLSIDGTTLLIKQFDFPLVLRATPVPGLFDEQGNQRFVPESRRRTQAQAFLAIPYYSEATEMRIYDDVDTLRLTIDLAAFVRCNQNGVCEEDAKESVYLCPEDCGLQTPTSKIPDWAKAALAAAVVLAILSFLFRRRRQ